MSHEKKGKEKSCQLREADNNSTSVRKWGGPGTKRYQREEMDSKVLDSIVRECTSSSETLPIKKRESVGKRLYSLRALGGDDGLSPESLEGGRTPCRFNRRLLET